METVPADPSALVKNAARDAREADLAIREGRFQRWLSLASGGASVLGGLEVAYEHYAGSYSERIMYTPVILSGALAVAGTASFFDKRAAKTVLPIVSAVTLGDSVLGFYFHVRGIARKPGGWRLPITNIVMGPPIFAPLLFGVSAYLGFIASFLKRDDEQGARLALPRAAHDKHWASRISDRVDSIDLAQDIREGRFQKQMAVATIVAAGFSGFESWYSHFKNNFRYGVQWTPVAIAPALMLAGASAVVDRRAAQTVLPLVSAIAVLNGTAGFFYHVRGVLRRPGGTKKLFYNIVYGPPIFAPLLFAASGSLGLLASLLRREKE